ncbi:MAG TPA: pyridoxal 5'-phosphate synthase glutaminase subunit PdxT [Acidimicrobiales bacterium]|nr:pyridoxal 5'-phosphate synthase glutaminase subunit PdxT [Acidimicrobiales bacterium]
MEIGVLSLQGDVAAHAAALADLGARVRAVRTPSDLPGIDGLVIPGGESTTMSMLLESSGLAEPLAKELDAGLPAFGTCAGLILLATAILDGRPDQRCFGAVDVTVRRNAFGRQRESFECDLEVRGLEGGPVHAVFIRAPVVAAVGPGVEVLADVPLAVAGTLDESGTLDALGAGGDRDDPRGEPGRAPVLCRQGRVLVSSFHPELTGDRRLHALFLSSIDQNQKRS